MGPIFRELRLSGAGHAIVGEPLTVEKEYAAVWVKARLDTDELARLRFGQGLKIKELQAHFGCSSTKVKKELRLLRLNPSLKLSLSGKFP